MKLDNSLKGQSIGGFIWKLFEKFGSQFVAMAIQIVLARLLMPSDYGIIGYMTLFLNLMDVFLKEGLTTALIQKEKIDQLDKSSVFFANLLISVFLYSIMFIIAPYVALFYSEPRLVKVMRVLSLNVIIGSFSAVHEALMAKALEFKKSFIRGLSNTVTYGIVGILLALNGAGIWALVGGKLAGAAVGALVLWITVKWRPTTVFSIKRLRKLFSFSVGVLGTNLLETFFHNVYALIIGRKCTAADLGYYQKGQNIPQTFMGSVDGSMAEVMYPTFSRLQNDIPRLKQALRRSIKLSMYICLPMLVGLMLLSKPLTLILLTEKWLPSVPYMQLMCVVTMFWPLSARLHALKALGKSKLTFRISLVNNTIYIIITVILVQFGAIFVMVAAIISNFIGMLITSYYSKKHIGYSFFEMLGDLWQTVVLVAVMGATVYCVSLLNLNIYITVVLQVLVGAITYILGSVVFKVDSFNYIIGIIKSKMGKQENEA